jgi:thiosulfate/3-mercaptopyruvate sulfurtransferase
MLRWVGHSRVAVLDGGWDAWTKPGYAVDDKPPVVQPTTFNPNLQAQLAVDTGFVSTRLARQEIRLLDARSADRYRGENETLDPVGGHIPGAINRFFKNNLDATGRFKSASELKLAYAELLGSQAPSNVVHQCGSGVTACHNLLAMEISGLTGSRLYPGSWSEWCSEPSRPVARGNAA